MSTTHINEAAHGEGDKVVYRTLCGKDLPAATALGDGPDILSPKPEDASCNSCRARAVELWGHDGSKFNE